MIHVVLSGFTWFHVVSLCCYSVLVIFVQSLADNALGSVGGEAVCEALVTNTALTSICLSGKVNHRTHIHLSVR